MQGSQAVPEKYYPSEQIKQCEFTKKPSVIQSVQFVAEVSHFKQFESHNVHFGSFIAVLSLKYPSGHY